MVDTGEHGIELRYVHADKPFIPDNLPVLSDYVMKFRTTVKFTATTTHAPNADAESLPKCDLRYKTSLERKQTDKDGDIRPLATKATDVLLTVPQLEAVAALYLDANLADPQVQSTAHAKIRSLNGPRCHAKLASFDGKNTDDGTGPKQAKMNFVGWLYKTFPDVAQTSPLLSGSVTVSHGMTTEEYDRLGKSGAAEEFEPEREDEHRSVLEQVDDGAFAGNDSIMDIVDEINGFNRDGFERELNHATNETDWLMHPGGGRNISPSTGVPRGSTRSTNAPRNFSPDQAASQPQWATAANNKRRRV
jgi:hypothetical protein